MELKEKLERFRKWNDTLSAYLMAWLGQKVHRYGNRYSMEEIIKKATGEDFTTSYYTTWLEEKYLKSGDLYSSM